jgi:ornithine cyclodeaminase
MLILDRAAVAACLRHDDCVDALDAAMRAVSAGNAIMPLRQYLPIPGTAVRFTLMPGYVDTPRCFGVKIVSKAERAPGSPWGSHVGAVMVFSPDDGVPVALLEGSELTAIRTAAASALATRTLARTDARRLAMIGCGLQAEHHVRALLQVRPIDRIVVWGRSQARVQEFLARIDVPPGVLVEAADSVAAAVADADIVTTVTSARTPILAGEWLKPGSHVNLVGAALREAAEADVEVVRRSRFFVDYRASAMAQAGELIDAIEQGIVTAGHIAGEIGEVLSGAVPGRRSETEITVYKSLGVAAQDLAAGWRAWERARERSLGIEVSWQ